MVGQHEEALTTRLVEVAASGTVREALQKTNGWKRQREVPLKETKQFLSQCFFFFFSKFFCVKYVVFISDRVRSKNSYLMHFNTVFPPELASI